LDVVIWIPGFICGIMGWYSR